MRRTIAFMLLLTATVLWAGCTTSENSNTVGNANMTPANANMGTANSNKANSNVHGNTNMGNMNMGNMNMGNKKPTPSKTP
jgi:hypothetical protein